jgi:hypothetical protein
MSSALALAIALALALALQEYSWTSVLLEITMHLVSTLFERTILGISALSKDRYTRKP